MLGIHFVSHAPFGRILAAILSHMPPDQPNWVLSEYMTLSDNNQIENRLYSSTELCSILKADDNVVVDYACLFATARTDIDLDDLPQTVKNYLASAFYAVMVCTDSFDFDLYCKNVDILYGVQRFLISSQICSPEEINVLTCKSDDRIGIYW